MNSFITTDLKKFEPLGLTQDDYKNALDLFKKEIEYTELTQAIVDYYNSYNLPDAVASDYCNKIIRIDKNRHIITSLRFRNLDIHAPYIEIILSDFEINDPAIILPIKPVILEQYKTKSPLFINCFITNVNTLNQSSDYDQSKLLVASRLTNKAINTNTSLFVKPLQGMNFYNEYKEQYEVFLAVDGNHDLSHIEDYDYLQELVLAGRLYGIYSHDKLIGIIGYDYSTIFSVSGISIVEEVLFNDYRGMGLAKSAQAQLISMLASQSESKSKIIFGTIHHRNFPSLRTALSNGRIILGSWFEYRINR